MDNTAARHALRDVRVWAKARIASGLETPEAAYQYLKLIEAADAILNDLDAAARSQSAPQADRHLRLVETRQDGGDDEARRVIQMAPLPV